MLDDEIVFLGQTSTSSRPAQRPVTGVVLHVEKNSEQDGHSMTFKRVNTTVVHIGRRSGFEPDWNRRSQDHDPASATFRCAVVSRKHAKIAFSDSGHAYLIDLGSHHGTHIRKPGEKFSKVIKAETPTVLVDGDIVTFGKSVGKGDELVRPIVARIELLEAGQSNANLAPVAFKPLVVPYSSASTPSTPERSHGKSTSGRYGIHASSSSSDESPSSNSGIYSDIEEISPPPSFAKPAEPEVNADCGIKSNNNNNVSSSSSNDDDAPSNGNSLNLFAYNVLKRFLPPAQTPPSPRRLPSMTEIVERPLAHMSSIFFGPEPVRTPPEYSPARDVVPTDELDINFLPPVVGFDASDHDIYENKDSPRNCAFQHSRSNSPMDLASPLPAAEVIVSRPLSIPPPAQPMLPGSYPPLVEFTRLPFSSDAGHSDPGDQGERMDEGPEIVASPANCSSNDSEASSRSASPVVPPGFRYRTSPVVEDVNKSLTPQTSRSSSSSPAASPSDAARQQMRQMQDSLDSIKLELAKLQTHRRKYKARFNSNVHVMSEKLGEFDDRLLEVNAEYIQLSNHVDRIQNEDLPELNQCIDGVQDGINELSDEFARHREREDISRAVAFAEMEDVKATLQTLNISVTDLEHFRQTAMERIEEEMKAIRTMRETAMAKLAEEIKQVQALKLAQPQLSLASFSNNVQTPVHTSLKRKRDDTDENEDVDDRVAGGIDGDEPEDGQEKDVVMVASSDDVSSTTTADLEVLASPREAGIFLTNGANVDLPSPRKRARRVASVVAQTATAVTIGAVVTWSALAFS